MILLGGNVLSRASCSMKALLQVACLPRCSMLAAFAKGAICSLHHQLSYWLRCNPPADLAGSNKVVLPNNVETMQSSAITVLSLEEGDVHQVCS